MKYKLLKEFPGYPIGYIFESSTFPQFDVFNVKAYPDFFEEVKEPKTIYDLKEGDNYWYLCSMNSVWKQNCMSSIKDDYKTSIFLTELEAKRNKLLRELATREKWLPTSQYEEFTTWDGDRSSWDGDEFDIIHYNMGLVFRNKEEYNKYITEEVKDLLFKL